MTLSAQNHCFFYVRFNPAEGNSSAIVNAIENIVNGTDAKFIVFISGGLNPLIFDQTNWIGAKNHILTVSNPPILFEEEEYVRLNEILSEVLDESATEYNNDIQLKGNNDGSLSLYFILSEETYRSETEMEYVPIELCRVNQFADRDVKVHWYSYSSSDTLIERNVTIQNK